MRVDYVVESVWVVLSSRRLEVMRSEARVSQEEKLGVNLRHIQCEVLVTNMSRRNTSFNNQCPHLKK